MSPSISNIFSEKIILFIEYLQIISVICNSTYTWPIYFKYQSIYLHLVVLIDNIYLCFCFIYFCLLSSIARAIGHKKFNIIITTLNKYIVEKISHLASLD